MSEETTFPTIDAVETVTTVTTIEQDAGALDLEKIDLKKLALAQFGDWRKNVTDVKAKLTGVVHDLSTQTKIGEAKTLRERLINAPRAHSRKVSKALKSKLAQASSDVGTELILIEGAYSEADQLITPQIEAADAKLEADRQEKARIEQERKDKHLAAIDAIRNVAERAKGLPSTRIRDAVSAVDRITIEESQWEDFTAQALAAKAATLDKLQDMIAVAEAKELAERLAEERRLLDEQQAQLKAEQDRLAQLEEERKAKIRRRMANLAGFNELTDRSVAGISLALGQLTTLQPAADDYDEFLDEALTLHAHVTEKLHLDLVEAHDRAAAEAKRAEEIAAQEAADREAAAQESARVLAEMKSAAAPAPAPEPVVEVAPAIVAVAEPVAQVRPAEPEQILTMSLRDINDAFQGRIAVSGDGMALLGFEALPTKGSAKLYRADQFGAICTAIADHAHTVAARRVVLEKAA